MEHYRYKCIGGVCPRRDFRRPLEKETRAEDLIVVLHTTYTGLKGLPGYSVSADGQEYYDAQRYIDCDEVYPGVFIGDGQTACNKQYLCNRIHVTHVLNAAEGKSFGYVNTDAKYYADTGIEYMGCHMIDAPSTNISQYFYPAADFIDNALRKGGRVYVHCVQGVSRSATLVVAYLMIKKGMLASEALRTVTLARNIQPNSGFLRQLADLDNSLRRSRS
ncbi:hypothetical protein TKK_0000702 [Trichogramma kaykai]|uniref:Dual specificity protein phosphatase n=1 Tax=Trichogramma kaykai TaxID=54128 RepID=A0ABD2WPW4_9HYME